MVNIRVYATVYVLLMILAVAKLAFFEFLDYGVALGLTIISAGVKTSLIVAYFQHLRYEPRILTVLMFTALLAVLILGSAASFSILEV